jgi:Rrf2 family protein
MIKLSKMTDYAVVVLGFLAKQAGKPMSAAQVAIGTRLPEPTVQKVLKLMASKKLITAQRGASGGYLLPLSLDCMNVYDVVLAIEGPIELDPCYHDGDNDCVLSKLYSPNSRWNKVNGAIKQTLKSIKLTELTNINNNNEIKERA